MLKKRRSFVTLLEVLIVITLLALMGGVIGVNVIRALKEQRFRTEVDMMVDTLRMAQDLMLILGTDVYVRIQVAENQKGIEYFLDVEGGVPKQWEPIVEKTRRLLKETHHISLEPRPVGTDKLDLRFLSGGSMMSKGVFRMSDHEDIRTPGALTAAICFKGYPRPIVKVYEKDDPIECLDETDQENENQLTFITTQEILEDNELKKASPPKEEKEYDGNNG